MPLLTGLDTDAVEMLLRHAGPEAGAPYLLEVRHLGGALARPSTVPNVMSRRDGQFSLYSGGVAIGEEVEPLRSTSTRLHDAMAPWGTGGVCVNFLTGPDVTGDQIHSAYLPFDLARLRQIKHDVDPTNMFRINHLATRPTDAPKPKQAALDAGEATS